MKISRLEDLVVRDKDHDCEGVGPSKACVRVEAVADLPTRFGEFRIVAFWNNRDAKEHVAIVRGDVLGAENVPTRLHSECLTGDAIGSLRCDCRDQLEAALETIGALERGLLVYLRTLLHPWAMFANGPPWMSAGTPSSVCTRFGFIASLNRASMASETLSLSAVTGSLSRVKAYERPVESLSQIVLVLGETEDGHDFGRGGDVESRFARNSLEGPAETTTMCRNERSFMSMTRRQSVRLGSKPSAFPK